MYSVTLLADETDLPNSRIVEKQVKMFDLNLSKSCKDGNKFGTKKVMTFKGQS